MRSSSPPTLSASQREEPLSEARGAKRTGALDGFFWIACFACALPVRMSGWGHRGGRRETVRRSHLSVCYSLEELHSHYRCGIT